MESLIYVGLGGFFGANARYLLSLWINDLLSSALGRLPLRHAAGQCHRIVRACMSSASGSVAKPACLRIYACSWAPVSSAPSQPSQRSPMKASH